MASSATGNPGGLTATVIVLYKPDDDTIGEVSALTAADHHVIAVSNGISDGQRRSLMNAGLLALIDNDRNVGLARALNQGIAAALKEGADHVLLLDQDSRPSATMLTTLTAAAVAAQGAGRRLACVAPMLVDRKSPAATVGGARAPLTVATSGSLFARAALEAVGPMWDALFIDGIDHEWCFRARAAGFSIEVDPATSLLHDMGDAGIRLFGRFRPVHRSPFRHYHIVRNTLWLARRRYIPWLWRTKECLKSLYRMPVYLLVSDDRRATLGALRRGMIDGLRSPPAEPVKW